MSVIACSQQLRLEPPLEFAKLGPVLMIKTMPDAVGPSLLRIVLIAVLYSLFFWRTIKSNRGNRVIECGCAALTVFMVLIVLINIKGLPEWLMPFLGALLLFLCLLTMFFLVQRTTRSFRRHRSKSGAFERMDTVVSFPLYVFEKDDRSMFVVESPDKVLYHMEPIDIENDEYLYWDVSGRAVRISLAGQRVTGISYGEPEIPLAEAFKRHSEAFAASTWTRQVLSTKCGPV